MSRVCPPPIPPVGAVWAHWARPIAQSGANGPSSGDRDSSGKFAPGNTARLVHGRRSERHLAALTSEAREALAAREAAILSDLGGRDSLSTLQLDLVARYVVAGALLSWMEDELLRAGVVTSKGRKRALFGAYAVQLGTVARLAQVLGLERRAKPLPSLAEHVAAAAAAARERGS